MQDFATGEITETVEFTLRTKTQPQLRKPCTLRPTVSLRSRVRGRSRWYIDILEDNPRLAAAVELVLRGEKGIKSAHANPLTGRVLIHYRPDLDSEWIEALIHQALEFGPMSREEFSTLRSKPDE